MSDENPKYTLTLELTGREIRILTDVLEVLREQCDDISYKSFALKEVLYEFQSQVSYYLSSAQGPPEAVKEFFLLGGDWDVCFDTMRDFIDELAPLFVKT